MPAKSDWGGSWIQPAGRDADTVGDGSRAVANSGHILAVHRPSDGRPHVTPLIAVWRTNALRFATGPEERKAKNLAENPSCVLTTGCSDLGAGALDVVLEGHAEQVTDDAELQPVATAFAVKYPTGPWDFVVRDGAFSDRDAGGRVIVFRVRPVRGMGFRKGDCYSQTTWRGL